MGPEQILSPLMARQETLQLLYKGLAKSGRVSKRASDALSLSDLSFQSLCAGGRCLYVYGEVGRGTSADACTRAKAARAQTARVGHHQRAQPSCDRCVPKLIALIYVRIYRRISSLSLISPLLQSVSPRAH